MKQRFRNLPIGGKLTLGFSLVLFFMALLGVIGYQSIRTIQRNLDDIFEVRLPSIDLIIEADRDLFQLIVAERSMMFTSAATERFLKLKAFYEENLNQSQERWERYKALAASQEERALIPKYEQARKTWEMTAGIVIKTIISSPLEHRQEAIELALSEAAEKFEAMRVYLDQLTEINLNMAQQTHDDAQATYTWTIAGFLAIVMLGLAVGVGLAMTMTIGITSPLRQAVKIANTLSSGDLSPEIAVTTTEETGQMLTAMKQMLETLRQIVKDVKGASENVASSSHELSSSATQMSEGANSQAASTEELSSSMQEMAANINQNANNALQTEKIALIATTDARKAKKAVRRTIKAMKNIAKEIVVIDEIAQQTRMLSLNATIEAGKAQDYGKGFAVVASEVRDLAGRTQIAAQKITELASSGVKIVKKTGESLDKLVPSIEKTAELVQEISAASREQDAGAQQVNLAVQNLDRIIQEHSAMSQQLAATAEELAAQATQLQNTIKFFHDEPSEQEDVPAKSPTTPRRKTKKEAVEAMGDKKENSPLLDISSGENPGDGLDDEFERF